MTFTEEQVREFTDAWKARAPDLLESSERERRKARERLPEAAEQLRARGARRIWLIGSMTGGIFDERSDVDIAVEGLSSNDTIELWGGLVELFGREVDLLRWEDLPGRFREAILSKGEPL